MGKSLSEHPFQRFCMISKGNDYRSSVDEVLFTRDFTIKKNIYLNERMVDKSATQQKGIGKHKGRCIRQ
jgi:hypothetical protein